MNETFYKYRADSEFTEAIFTSGQVFLSTAQGLNDPFECSLQEIGRDWINEQVMKMKQAAVVGFVIQAKRAMDNNEIFFNLLRQEIERLLDSFRGHGNIDESYDFYAQFILEKTGHRPSDSDRLFSGIDAQLNSVGIFSMSVKADHPLMWAHYAGDHTGICLGFTKVSDLKLAHPEHLFPVTYSDSLPEIEKEGFQVQMAFSMDDKGRGYTSSFKIAFTDKTFQRAITTKPTCWSYEEEWRYIEPYSGLFEWPGTLSEITFGLRCSEERRNHYIRLAEEHIPNEVRLFHVRKRPGSNFLERLPLPIPVTRPKRTTRLRENVGQETEKLGERVFASRMERLVQQEKYGEVLFQVDQNLKQNPDSPVLLHLKGVAHGFAKEHDKALQCFIKLTTLFPDVAQGWYQLSCAYVALGKHEQALDALNRAFVLDPNNPSISFNLGIELLYVKGTPDDALVYLRRADQLGHRRALGAIKEIEELVLKQTNK